MPSSLRVGRAYGPDSSLAALSRALLQPLDGLETDCCLTADGQLVLLHDPLLEVGTTVPGRASAHTGGDPRGPAAQPRRVRARSARCSSTSYSTSRRPPRPSSSRSMEMV